MRLVARHLRKPSPSTHSQIAQSGRCTPSRFRKAVRMRSNVAAHELGAAAYAIKAPRAAVPGGESESTGRLECRWQRDQMPHAIRDLVLDDQRLRSDICWSVFDC